MMTTEQKIWLWGKMIGRALWPFLIYASAPGFCMAIGYVITRPDMTAQEFFVYGSNFYTTIGMALSIWFLSRYCQKHGRTLNEEVGYYPEQVNWKKTAFFAVFGVAAAICLSAVLTLFPLPSLIASYSQASSTMYRGKDLAFAIVTTVILSPFLEETVFRGFMLNRFLESVSEKTAVYLSAALFAICHANPIWIAYAFFMGFVMSRVSMKEDGIFYSICIHIGFNAPSAITCIINSFGASQSFFFSSKALIGCYGLAAALVLVLLYKIYKKELLE